MKVGIYDPYLDSLGGGERYILTIASYLSQKNDVSIFWDNKTILRDAEKKLQIDLSSVFTVENIFNNGSSFFKKISKTKNYDLFIFVSDGSIPFLFAKRNILIFQFPVNWVNGKSMANKIKMGRVEKIVCYTNFVKKYLDNTLDINSEILYPPVPRHNKNNSTKKENIILSVGRFTKAMNMKKQEVMIDSFIELYKKGVKDWKLVLIGSFLEEDIDFVTNLKRISNGYPIEIITNASYKELINYYEKSKIYWHAAGFGEDLVQHPERAEHFGITTVEAMAAGCVPIVINAGGQPEIVEDQISGYLWNTTHELLEYTKKIIKNEKLRSEIAIKARSRAKYFSEENFYKRLTYLINQE